MQATEVSRIFKRKIGSGYKLEPDGVDRFIVYTPFAFDDGDHFVVVLKKEGNNWLLTDEGHTFMHLSYDDVDLSLGARSEVIERTLLASQVENQAGELRLAIPNKDFGDAVSTFLQTLSRIATTALWTQERIASTFFDDATNIILQSIPFGMGEQGWTDPDIDPDRKYKVDLMIRGQTRKWFIFAIANDGQCQQATITCLHYEKHKAKFNNIVIYQNQLTINKLLIAQLSDALGTGKSFSSLSERDRISEYLKDEVVGTSKTNY